VILLQNEAYPANAQEIYILAADTHRHTQTIKIFCLSDLPRQKLHMPFRHKHNNYREAIDCFCLRKSRRQKVCARLCVSSEQSERAANKNRFSKN